MNEWMNEWINECKFSNGFDYFYLINERRCQQMWPNQNCSMSVSVRFDTPTFWLEGKHLTTKLQALCNHFISCFRTGVPVGFQYVHALCNHFISCFRTGAPVGFQYVNPGGCINTWTCIQLCSSKATNNYYSLFIFLLMRLCKRN